MDSKTNVQTQSPSTLWVSRNINQIKWVAVVGIGPQAGEAVAVVWRGVIGVMLSPSVELWAYWAQHLLVGAASVWLGKSGAFGSKIEPFWKCVCVVQAWGEPLT